jgi:hypothetical protein
MTLGIAFPLNMFTIEHQYNHEMTTAFPYAYSAYLGIFQIRAADATDVAKRTHRDGPNTVVGVAAEGGVMAGTPDTTPGSMQEGTGPAESVIMPHRYTGGSKSP